jgi:hypothetical protein
MKDFIFASYRCTWPSVARLMVLLIGVEVWAADAFVTPISPGIYFSQQTEHRLSPAQKDKLEASLRRITGWQQLRADKHGHLLLEETSEFVAGSVWARRVLRAILRSGHRFVIENHFAAPTIHFGQLDQGTKYEDERAGIKLEIYRVRLDLADFQNMQAAPEVRAAFDEGFTLLHELLHGLGLQDTSIRNEIGDCEQIINRIRMDLGLPLRDQYLGDLLITTPKIKTVRLRFKSQKINGEGIARRKTQYLFFAFYTDSSQLSKEKILTALFE